MVKRARPILVRLPNGRTFISRYKRSTGSVMPPDIEVNRPCKRRPVPKKKHQQYSAAQQQGRSLVSILKFEKKNAKNLLVKKFCRTALNELGNLYSKGTNKIKNEKLKRILQSDVASHW